MTPADLKSARLGLGLTQSGLARALTNLGFPRSRRTIEGWEQGRASNPIPAWLPLVINMLAAKGYMRK